MIIILLTNRNLAYKVVGTFGKHLAGSTHAPAKRRINIHLLLAALTAGLLGLAALGVVECDKFAPPANGAKNQLYAGPMHPELARNAAGNRRDRAHPILQQIHASSLKP